MITVSYLEFLFSPAWLGTFSLVQTLDSFAVTLFKASHETPLGTARPTLREHSPGVIVRVFDLAGLRRFALWPGETVVTETLTAGRVAYPCRATATPGAAFVLTTITVEALVADAETSVLIAGATTTAIVWAGPLLAFEAFR